MKKPNYWLMKSEPSVYSIDDLYQDTTTQWEGVRNYQARNFMKNDMSLGDQVFFYHSNTKPPGIVGLAEVSKLAYPDHFAWDKTSAYFDPKSTPENPRWFMVDVAFKKKFQNSIDLDMLKQRKDLDGLLVIKKGMRLSIQPVTPDHASILLSMAK